MKKACLALFIYCISINIYGQNQNDLFGKWRITSKEGSLTLMKITEQDSPNNLMGRFIEFKSDGTYEESASARCGLDDDRYHYTGKWKYHKKRSMIELIDIKVINDRPNIYKYYKVLSSGKIHVESLQNNQLTAKLVKPWEKISPKNNPGTKGKG